MSVAAAAAAAADIASCARYLARYMSVFITEGHHGMYPLPDPLPDPPLKKEGGGGYPMRYKHIYIAERRRTV